MKAENINIFGRMETTPFDLDAEVDKPSCIALKR